MTQGGPGAAQAPVTDAHVHLWRLARGDNRALSPAMAPIYKDREPNDLAPELAAAGVARVVVVQAAETLAEIFFLLGLARRFPVIAGIVAWADPGSPSIEEEAAALGLQPLIKGVRPVRDDNATIAWMLDARLDRGVRALTEAGLALDVLVQNWREIGLATELARRHPQARIVLDHCGKPDIAGGAFAPWADDIAALAGLPNVACKLSGLMNCAKADAGPADIRPYAAHAIERFGPQRVLWGSDWPPLALASTYARWKQVSDLLLSDLSGDDRAAILGGTAARVYRLDPPSQRSSATCP
jgi:L-fuconolactonase